MPATRDAASFRRRLTLTVFPGKHPVGERKVGKEHHSECRALGEHGLGGRTVEETVLVLNTYKPGGARFRRLISFGELLRGEVRAADLSHLPRLHELVQGTERFGDRDGFVGSVELIQVDVVGTEPPEAVLCG